MTDQNLVALTGRLGSTPELRTLPNGNGTQVVEINLAVTTGWGDRERTTWVGLKVWQKRAEVLSRLAPKGTRIWVTGELCQDEWTDRETGQSRRKTFVNVRQWDFCEGKRKMDEAPNHADPDPPAPAAEDDGDEIPF